jgi:hypothetical protein
MHLTITNTLYVNFNILNFFNLNNSYHLSLLFSQGNTKNNLSNTYASSPVNYSDFNQTSSYIFSENSSSWRFNRYSYPLISYDYKTGNYLSIWEQLYPALTLSFIEVARGIRKAPWYFTDQYTDSVKNNYNTFVSKFTNQLNLKLSDIDG